MSLVYRLKYRLVAQLEVLIEQSYAAFPFHANLENRFQLNPEGASETALSFTYFPSEMAEFEYFSSSCLT